MPKNLSIPPTDSKKAHFQFLQKSGRNIQSLSRQKRRAIRSALKNNDNKKAKQSNATSEKVSVFLESSSSDSDTSQEHVERWKKETVDFDQLQQESSWGSDCLFGIMPVSETSQLVGWAMHQTRDGESSDNVLQDSPPVNNPLLFQPNTPLPPSYLQFLSNKAMHFAEAHNSSQAPVAWEEKSFLAHSDISDGPGSDGSEEGYSKRRRKRKRGVTLQNKKKTEPWLFKRSKPWQTWECNKKDETYQWLLQHRTLTESYKLHVPRPKAVNEKPSRETTDEIATPPETDTMTASLLYESLDDSALVALGVVWEECLTAMLLPLAQRHVEKCRALEQLQQEKNPTNTTHWKDLQPDAFQEWTLPPEEAVVRLTTDQKPHTKARGAFDLGCLPTAHPPTWSTRTPSVDDVLLSSGSPKARKQAVVEEWCRRHELDPQFVTNNWDLYQALLPVPPRVPVQPLCPPAPVDATARRASLKQKRAALYNQQYQAKYAKPKAQNEQQDELSADDED